jgi:hypothetical protein
MPHCHNHATSSWTTWSAIWQCPHHILGERPTVQPDQLADPSSVICIDRPIPNAMFLLPQTTTTGIQSFAWSVVLRPHDLWDLLYPVSGHFSWDNLPQSVPAGGRLSIFAAAFRQFTDFCCAHKRNEKGPKPAAFGGQQGHARHKWSWEQMINRIWPQLYLAQEALVSTGSQLFSLQRARWKLRARSRPFSSLTESLTSSSARPFVCSLFCDRSFSSAPVVI